MARQQRATLTRRRVGRGTPTPHDPRTDSERLTRIDLTLKAIQNTLDVQFKRIAALQAQVDRLSGKDPR